jgi:gluconolactonase
MAIELDANTSALIIQDLQNDVIVEGGAFADSGAPAHAKSQNVVANVASMAAVARAAGMAVIHVHYIVEPGAPGLKLNAPLFQREREQRPGARQLGRPGGGRPGAARRLWWSKRCA